LYETKAHPDGPSFSKEICPQHESLGSFKNNKAHSMGRFGLRLFRMVSLENPCGNVMN